MIKVCQPISAFAFSFKSTETNSNLTATGLTYVQHNDVMVLGRHGIYLFSQIKCYLVSSGHYVVNKFSINNWRMKVVLTFRPCGVFNRLFLGDQFPLQCDEMQNVPWHVVHGVTAAAKNALS